MVKKKKQKLEEPKIVVAKRPKTDINKIVGIKKTCVVPDAIYTKV